MKDKEVSPPHGESHEVGNLKHQILTSKGLRPSTEVKSARVGPIGVKAEFRKWSEHNIHPGKKVLSIDRLVPN